MKAFQTGSYQGTNAGGLWLQLNTAALFEVKCLLKEEREIA